MQLAKVNQLANALKADSIDAAILWDATAAQYPEIETVAMEVFMGSAAVSEETRKEEHNTREKDQHQ